MLAAPIGNLGDISLRALEVLRAADVVAAEDTRVAKRLLAAHGIRGKQIISARAQNESAAAQKIVSAMLNGKYQNAAYLSDAGTPGISDPGARLAKRAREAGIAVTAIPGASALSTLLCIAGARAESAHFFGFPPRAKEQRRKFFMNLSQVSGDIVIFESPRRAADACLLLKESLGENARIVIGRELTKAHEQIKDDTAANIVLAFANGEIPARGEFTILAESSPSTTTATATPETIFRELLKELPPRRAATITARLTGANANTLYRNREKNKL